MRGKGSREETSKIALVRRRCTPPLGLGSKSAGLKFQDLGVPLDELLPKDAGRCKRKQSDPPFRAPSSFFPPPSLFS